MERNRENFRFTETFRQEIRARYGQSIPPMKMHGYSDAYFPFHILANRDMGEYGLISISPNCARIMGTHLESFQTVIKMIGIDIVRVRQNLEKIKRQNTEIVQIGYGGFGINSLYFMSELAKICGVYHPFSKLVIYEDDIFTTANAVRIFKDLTAIPINSKDNAYNPIKKLDLFTNEENLSGTIIKRDSYFDASEISRYKKRAYYLGAPDFTTRKLLENNNFLFTGHSGNEVELFGRPVINKDIATETYGTINVFYFFLNILKASEMIIDVIANEEEIPTDKSLGVFNSEEYIKGIGGNSF